MNKIIAKIKRKENKFYYNIYYVGRKIFSLNMPVGFYNRWFYLFIYQFRRVVKPVFRYLKQKLYVEPTTKSLFRVGENVHIEEIPSVSGSGTFAMGNNVQISGHLIITYMNKYNDYPVLEIGSHTFVGHMSRISVSERVKIGCHVYLAAGCMILDNDGHPIDSKKRRQGEHVEKDKIFPVIIEDDVWIGNGVMILKGVTVGARSIVAARSVVTKSIPPDSVAGGNPCKIIKSLLPM